MLLEHVTRYNSIRTWTENNPKKTINETTTGSKANDLYLNKKVVRKVCFSQNPFRDLNIGVSIQSAIIIDGKTQL